MSKKILTQSIVKGTRLDFSNGPSFTVLDVVQIGRITKVKVAGRQFYMGDLKALMSKGKLDVVDFAY